MFVKSLQRNEQANETQAKRRSKTKLNKMRLRHFLLSFLFSSLSLVAFSQTQDAGLSGNVTDETTKEPIDGAIIRVYSSGILRAAKMSDDEGKYNITGLQPGLVDSVIAIKIGYEKFKIVRVNLYADKTQDLYIKMSVKGKTLKNVEVVVFKDPLINKKNPGVSVITREDFQHAAGQGSGYLLVVQPGVISSSQGLNLAGGRGDGTVYYLDGIKVLGSMSIPQTALEQSTILTSGIGAEYGDATGGIVTVTSRGPTGVFSGGISALSSQLLDAYGYNYFDGYLSGPIWKTKAHGDSIPSRPLIDFFISGSATLIKDPSPSGIPIYTANSNVMNALNANPLIRAPKTDINTINTDIFLPAASYVGNSGITTVAYHPNIPSQSYSFTGKLEYQPVNNITITAYASGNYNSYLAYIPSFSMFNTANNPQVINETYRGFIRFKQNIATDPKSIIQGASYSIQGDYQTVRNTTWDKNLKDDYFKYGYIGTFDQYTRRSYTVDPTTHVYSEGNYLIDSVKFKPGNVLTTEQNYTREYFANKSKVYNLQQIQNEGGLVNGQSPTNVNSLWSGVGTVYGSVSKSQTDQFNLYFSGSFQLKQHAIKFGFNYEQRVSSGYTVATTGLWTLARQLANSHLSVDTTRKDSVFDKYGNFLDTINYRFQSANQRTFDKNFREYLISQGATDIHGKPISSESFINTDGYNPGDYNNLSKYLASHGRLAGKLNMFSADELLNQGSSLVSYYGYDYLGNSPSKKLTVNDFLNDSLHRYIAAFQPIYIAGYVQDQFDFYGINFRLGLRIDRYDANQPVLIDQYSMLPTYTAGDIDGKYFGTTKYTKPGNIGSSYVPYVNDPLNPTVAPIGYRDPATNKWYDATGKEVTDVTYLANLNGGTLTPYIKGAGISRDNLNKPIAASFQQYTPQTSYSPRVSFSFPISDVANFYANYDILSQRPTSNNFFSIDNYYFLKERATGVIDNPNLKPQTRINYQVGFKQIIGKVSVITLEANYGELRNMIQIRKINFAYPVSTYTTYDNIDFGTVKGLNVIYEYRRAAASGIAFKANYGLQFANGTGSSSGSQGGLIAAGQPNLRTPLPLDYDVRHKLNATVDYRFGDGLDYTGPSTDKSNGINTVVDKVYRAVFENAGFFALFTASSGMPYSRQSNVTTDVEIGVAQRTTLLGQPNDARLPWNYRVDLSYDKNILVKSKKNQENSGSKGSDHYINLRVTIQNLFNIQNIFGVYRYTGRPDDDGYLASAEGQKTLSNIADLAARQAFVDQYNARLLSPGNYGSPRVIRLGLSYAF